jgi:lysozyme
MEEAELEKVLDILTKGHRIRGTEEFRDKAETVYQEAREWSAHASIQGFGIAERTVGGEETGELVLKIYVDRITPDHSIPAEISVPDINTPVPIDVEAIGRIEPQAHTTSERPARGGSNISHVRGHTGTLGCLVQKRNIPGSVYILSSAHVMALSGAAESADQILQPSADHGGTVANDVIAVLDQWIPLDASDERFPNPVDAAVAKAVAAVRADIGGTSSPLQIEGVTPVGRGFNVTIYGAQSGPTPGRVIDRHFRVRLTYPTQDGLSRVVSLYDQVLCKASTQPGDSGAIVLDQFNFVAGLHIAGSGSWSVFTPIDPILLLLNLEIITGAREPRIDAPVPRVEEQDINREKLRQQLILHEGLKLKSYLDTEGHLTIGVGRNLDANPVRAELGRNIDRVGQTITAEEARILLDHDIEKFIGEVRANIPEFEPLSEPRQHVLIDMAFNLGTQGLLKFEDTLRAIGMGDFDTAAAEMLNSRWAVQVGERAQRLSRMMRNDRYFDEV